MLPHLNGDALGIGDQACMGGIGDAGPHDAMPAGVGVGGVGVGVGSGGASICLDEPPAFMVAVGEGVTVEFSGAVTFSGRSTMADLMPAGTFIVGDGGGVIVCWLKYNKISMASDDKTTIKMISALRFMITLPKDHHIGTYL